MKRLVTASAVLFACTPSRVPPPDRRPPRLPAGDHEVTEQECFANVSRKASSVVVPPRTSAAVVESEKEHDMFTRAQQELALGRPEDALQSFLRAREPSRNPATTWNIAKLQLELGFFVEARANSRTAARDACSEHEKLCDRLTKMADDVAVEADKHRAEITFVPPPRSHRFQFMVDAELVTGEALTKREINPGAHEVRLFVAFNADSPSDQCMRVQIDATAHDQLELRVHDDYLRVLRVVK